MKKKIIIILMMTFFLISIVTNVQSDDVCAKREYCCNYQRQCVLKKDAGKCFGDCEELGNNFPCKGCNLNGVCILGGSGTIACEDDAQCKCPDPEGNQGDKRCGAGDEANLLFECQYGEKGLGWEVITDCENQECKKCTQTGDVAFCFDPIVDKECEGNEKIDYTDKADGSCQKVNEKGKNANGKCVNCECKPFRCSGPDAPVGEISCWNGWGWSNYYQGKCLDKTTYADWGEYEYCEDLWEEFLSGKVEEGDVDPKCINKDQYVEHCSSGFGQAGSHCEYRGGGFCIDPSTGKDSGNAGLAGFTNRQQSIYFARQDDCYILNGFAYQFLSDISEFYVPVYREIYFEKNCQVEITADNIHIFRYEDSDVDQLPLKYCEINEIAEKSIIISPNGGTYTAFCSGNECRVTVEVPDGAVDSETPIIIKELMISDCTCGNGICEQGEQDCPDCVGKCTIDDDCIQYNIDGSIADQTLCINQECAVRISTNQVLASVNEYINDKISTQRILQIIQIWIEQ